MLLSKIVEQSAEQFGSLPCCVLQIPPKNDCDHVGEEQKKTSNSTTSAKFLSYHGAALTTHQHETWLRQRIKQVSYLSQQQPQQQQIEKPRLSHNKNIATVIAYISSNSVDFLLSVLACTSIKRVGHNNNNESHRTNYNCIPALLNTRWTSSEMASALQTSLNSNNNNTIHRTFILYGAEFESTAHRVRTILQQHLPPQQQQHHEVHILAIPQFSNQHMHHRSSSDNSNNNNNSKTINYHGRHYHQTTTSINDNDEDKNVNYRIDCLISQAMKNERVPSTSSKNGNKSDNNDNDMIENHNDYDGLDAHDAIILFTSGTTGGGSKGVRLSHKALYIQALAKIRSPCRYSTHTNMLASTVPIFHVGGLNSVLALLLAGGSWVFPYPQQQQQGGGFHPSTVLQSLSHPLLQANTLVVVPAMIHTLLKELSLGVFRNNENPKRRGRTYPSVRLILIGGQSINSKTVQHLQYIFPFARLVQTYACTEAASSMTFHDILKSSPGNKPNTIDDRNHNTNSTSTGRNTGISSNIGYCVGIPPPHVKLALLEHTTNDDKEESEQGSNNNSATTKYRGSSSRTPTTDHAWIHTPYQIGIIATKGPHVMNGYWSHDTFTMENKTTHRTVSKKQQHRHNPNIDNWFVTNDLGFFDKHGQLYFTGRVRDVIRTGGETVVATEVEQVLLQHPHIEDCAVFPLDDETFGQTVCAALVLKNEDHQENVTLLSPSSSPTATNNDKPPQSSLAQMRVFCANQNLAGYKRPRRIFWLSANEMPRNSSGKILKHQLVERFRRDSPPLLNSKL